MKDKIIEILDKHDGDIWVIPKGIFPTQYGEIADEILALLEGEEGTCANAVGLWCDRWDGQKHGNQTCDDWRKTHWCEINITP